MAKGHAPQYPPYYTKAPERVLAYYTPGEGIVTEHNKRFVMPTDLSTLRDILWTENLLLFVDSIPGFPLLPELIYDYPKTEVLATTKGEAIGIRLTGEKNTSRWIVSATRWGYSASTPLLALLRVLYAYCHVGCASTPGALGQALMRHTYSEHHLRRHTRPRGAVFDLIHKHGFGGRVDTPGQGKHYERLLELDMKGAYNAHYRKHPTGTSVRCYATTLAESERLTSGNSSYVTWFGQCEIHLRRKLSIGPFPVRLLDNGVTYPTEPGVYHCWLWREQALDILQLGGTIHSINGWGWEQWTEDNTHYSAVMECLRREAPSPEIASLIKAATVAGIGRHAMNRSKQLLVPPEHKSKGDKPIHGSQDRMGLLYDWYVHDFPDPYCTNMIHWHNYTVMQTNRTLFWKAKEYADRGALVATNYDAVYVSLWRYEELALPEKGSREDNDAESGTWRYRILYPKDNHTPMIPAPRHLIARDAYGEPVVRRPGVHENG